ncbi:MAG: hypothetical protein UX80_C0015G0012 [Candidatus Amesbacteria bacterium GW2011_GWA2_47_11b]|uniref:Uncharacterized protein n=1 Tax=Candidatus Amesbacteria bacterium GW2011_GWA2_47_11b TaxID=1618358 RepID=A0A0G1TTH0_9BACT|nr:MAG: hypothetical protein UX80_C0015G0012 [Candidatus Amesbacteria bacterium GW2011_GWA2_47_11b]
MQTCLMGQIKKIELENRNTNITQELSRIFNAFSDFRLVAQIREEIEKVKPSLAFTSL